MTDGLTTDPNDPRLKTHDPAGEKEPTGQNEAYLILPEEARREQEFVRPLRLSYNHVTCGRTTTMAEELAETYARNPKFYAGTFCASCQLHRPVAEFFWVDEGTREVTKERVGS